MKTIEYRPKDGIAWITLNRPEKRNAINREMNEELWALWREFDRDPELRVAILTGAGDRAFCAGADLTDYIPTFYEDSARKVRENAATGIGGITRGLHRIYKPIIAAVNGFALAGGFELALACDVRIASRTAAFGSFEMRHGFHHADGGIVRLLASVGLSRTLDIVLSGREVSAQEALQIGLLSEVVEPDQLLASAERYARRLLESSPAALRSAKETILE
ncbi:MAG: enoyl-CoA hydratase/isomerase family protein, partial [Candidatus Binatia bacterium]